MLDRMSKAWVMKQPVHFDRGTQWWQRHKYFVIASSFRIFLAAVTTYSNLSRSHTQTKFLSGQRNRQNHKGVFSDRQHKEYHRVVALVPKR